MRIVHSLPHPHGSLQRADAGYLVRAKALLEAMAAADAVIRRVEASGSGATRAAVRAYRSGVRRAVPAPLALPVRDLARTAKGVAQARTVAAAVRAHRADVILETHIAFSAAGALAAQRERVPLVLDDVTPHWEEERVYGVGSPRLARRLHRSVTAAADLVVAVNRQLVDLLVDDGIDRRRIVVVPNGVDEAFREAVGDRGAMGLPRDRVVVLFVGTFQPYHEVELLIDAVAIALREGSPLHLVLVGTGRTHEAAVAAVHRAGLDADVTITGHVDYAEIPAWVAAADIGAMPATNDYGDPMKIYEYLAGGLAVVAPDKPTVRSIVDDGVEGALFVPGDVRGLAARLMAMAADPGGLASMRAAARQRGVGHLWSARARVLLDAMTDVVGAAGGAGRR